LMVVCYGAGGAGDYGFGGELIVLVRAIVD
jgi:hypothetical protein